MTHVYVHVSHVQLPYTVINMQDGGGDSAHTRYSRVEGTFTCGSYSPVDGTFTCVSYSCVEGTFTCGSYSRVEGGFTCGSYSHLNVPSTD